MKPVSTRDRDEMMRFITNYYFGPNSLNVKLRSDDPGLLALGNRIDLDRTVNVLVGLGLLQTTAFSSYFHIFLSPGGKCYFEKKADARRELWMKSILIPILLAAMTTILTVYLLPRLGEGAAQFLATLQGSTPQSSQAPAPTYLPSGGPSGFPIASSTPANTPLPTLVSLPPSSTTSAALAASQPSQGTP